MNRTYSVRVPFHSTLAVFLSSQAKGQIYIRIAKKFHPNIDWKIQKFGFIYFCFFKKHFKNFILTSDFRSAFETNIIAFILYSYLIKTKFPFLDKIALNLWSCYPGTDWEIKKSWFEFLCFHKNISWKALYWSLIYMLLLIDLNLLYILQIQRTSRSLHRADSVMMPYSFSVTVCIIRFFLQKNLFLHFLKFYYCVKYQGNICISSRNSVEDHYGNNDCIEKFFW